jgi:branched-chain amino acid transport system substrate-binding protein
MKRFALCLSLLFAISCALVPPPEPPDMKPEQSRDESLGRIRTLRSEGDASALRKAGASFISRFPEDQSIDEVRLITAEADIELGFYDEALEVLFPLTVREVADAAGGRAHILVARAYKAKGLFDKAALSALSALSADLDETQRETAREQLESVVRLLPREELDAIMKSHASAPGVEYVFEAALSYARASQDTAEAGRIIAELEELEREAPPVEQPFEEEAAVPVPLGGSRDREVRYSVGVLCPLGGRYAPLGSEFLKGASVAMKEAREGGLGGAEIVVGDTRGDPLVTRSVAERLIVEEGVVALVGCVLSSSTIVAAHVAEHHGTVLLSPVATEEGIAEIGEHVFQIGSDIEVEIAALARLACGELRLRRIAYLAVDDLRSRRLGGLFDREVTLAGGEVCISAYYPEGSTDFHEMILNLREAAPEALFIASDVEDLILILPQLSFYEFGAQLLGLSTWHSSRLLRMAGRDMEGALFPAHTGERRDEEEFMAAAVLIDEPVEGVNPFVLGGYKGVKTLLAAIEESERGGGDIEGTLIRTLHQRRHPFVELVSGEGVPFYTVRDSRLEPYAVLTATQ